MLAEQSCNAHLELSQNNCLLLAVLKGMHIIAECTRLRSSLTCKSEWYAVTEANFSERIRKPHF